MSAISDLIGHADRHLPLKATVGGILDDVRIESWTGTPIAELENPAHLAADLSDGDGDDYTAEEAFNETVSLARLFIASPELYSAGLELVYLHDQLKQIDTEAYERRKPLAWEALRKALQLAEDGEGA